LKPHKTIRSLHDPEISNTRFDNNSKKHPTALKQ
jgi:hypothetical protein